LVDKSSNNNIKEAVQFLELAVYKKFLFYPCVCRKYFSCRF